MKNHKFCKVCIIAALYVSAAAYSTEFAVSLSPLFAVLALTHIVLASVEWLRPESGEGHGGKSGNQPGAGTTRNPS